MSDNAERQLGLDHIALEVTEIQQRITQFEALGLTVGRVGHLSADPNRRIVMMHDKRSGFKIELIEGADERLAHVAVRTDDVRSAVETGVPGFVLTRAPYRLEAAKAESAMLDDGSGLTVQFVQYDADSPDL